MKTLLSMGYALAVTVLLSVYPCLAETITIGVAPHLNSPTVLETYQPLRQYLQEELGCEVELVTEPDLNEFVRRGLAGAYDIAVTTVHQGRLFQSDAGYIPLLVFKDDNRLLIIVSDSSTARTLRDLDSQDVFGTGPTSEATLWGKHWLKVHLADATLKHVETPESVAERVSAGEAAAGFISRVDYLKLPERLRDRLRILAKSAPVGNGLFLVSGRLIEKRMQIEAALWGFTDTPQASKFFSDNNSQGFRRLKSYEMNAFDIYAAAVRKLVKAE